MPSMNFSPYDAKQAEINRMAQYADALRQQGMEAPQGQMAGRTYVPPSWTQGLAQMLKAYGGGKGVRMAEEQSQALAGERSQKIAEALRGGDPEAMMQNPDTMGYGLQLKSQQDQRQFASGQAAEARRFREDEARKSREQRTIEMQQQQAFQAEQARLAREAQAAALNARLAQGNAAPDPYYQALPTAEGYMTFDARTGRMVPVEVDGKPVMPGTLDPALQGDLAAAKKGGALTGEAAAQAQMDLPAAMANVEKVNQQLDELLAHPGFSGAVGAKGASQLFGVLPAPVAGTDAAGFNARLEQLSGGAFLEARQMLKGGGAITDFESKKAEAAFSRMSTAVSEKEFAEAAEDYRAAVSAGVDKLRGKAGMARGASGDFGAPQTAAPASGGLTPEEEAELAQLRQELNGGR